MAEPMEMEGKDFDRTQDEEEQAGKFDDPSIYIYSPPVAGPGRPRMETSYKMSNVVSRKSELVNNYYNEIEKTYKVERTDEDFFILKGKQLFIKYKGENVSVTTKKGAPLSIDDIRRKLNFQYRNGYEGDIFIRSELGIIRKLRPEEIPAVDPEPAEEMPVAGPDPPQEMPVAGPDPPQEMPVAGPDPPQEMPVADPEPAEDIAAVFDPPTVPPESEIEQVFERVGAIALIKKFFIEEFYERIKEKEKLVHTGSLSYENFIMDDDGQLHYKEGDVDITLTHDMGGKPEPYALSTISSKKGVG